MPTPSELRQCTFPEYRAIERLHFSVLKHMDETPADFHWHLTHPGPVTDPMRAGAATHTLSLEPDRFPREFVVWEGKVRNGHAWDDFRETAGTKTIVTAVAYEKACAVRDAVQADEHAQALLVGGKAEQTILWELDGFRLKSRPDYVGAGGIVDLKVMAAIDPRSVSKAIQSYKYHAQGAMYVNAVEAATTAALPYALLTVRSTPPHLVQVYRIPADLLKIGRELYRGWLTRVRECQQEGRWIGYADGPIEAELPAWAYDSEGDFGDSGLTMGGEPV
jgi:hypothetical protein